jgi:hypothetical protein
MEAQLWSNAIAADVRYFGSSDIKHEHTFSFSYKYHTLLVAIGKRGSKSMRHADPYARMRGRARPGLVPSLALSDLATHRYRCPRRPPESESQHFFWNGTAPLKPRYKFWFGKAIVCHGKSCVCAAILLHVVASFSHVYPHLNVRLLLKLRTSVAFTLLSSSKYQAPFIVFNLRPVLS